MPSENQKAIKSYIQQVMNMELHLLTLKKTNEELKEKIRDTEESNEVDVNIKRAQQRLNAAYQNLMSKDQIVESMNSSYEYYKNKKIGGLWYNIFHETLPTIFVLLLCSLIGFSLGYWIPNFLDAQTVICVIIGIVFGCIGLFIGFFYAYILASGSILIQRKKQAKKIK